MATTIRKALISAFDAAPSAVSVVTAPAPPPPPPGHVQLAVVYSGFSGADVNMRRGWYPMQRAPPLTPGYCLAGRVRAAGPGCAPRFRPGAAVCALTVYDAQAELVNLPEALLVPVPDGLGLDVACALTFDWTTAFGMVEHAAAPVLAPGARVFVHGLSGAVGHALLALCRRRGATVYGTASPAAHAALDARGARAFDHADKAWITEMRSLGGVHAVFDPLGFESFDDSYSILSAAEPSRLVGFGANLPLLTGAAQRRVPIPYMLKLLLRNLALWSHKSTRFFVIRRDAATFRPDLDALFKLALDGAIEPCIRRVWALDDIRDAHQSWGKPMPGIGSLLIRVSDDDDAAADAS